MRTTPTLGTGLAAVATYPSDTLRGYLDDKMERGGLFAQVGIRNFLEGDFFGWYLDVWDGTLDAALRRLIGDLANYSLVTLDVDPEETRDLLKHLYQNLMPKKLRHALGEYYTPDWLAERLLNQLGYDGDPRKRLLDPACGSGTFLVLALKRVRRFAAEHMLEPSRVVEQVLHNVVGFDLNPLAVITARTNYLLGLGELLESRHGDVSIPVYLADSVLTPSQSGELFTHYTYSFNTAVGRFAVPRSLVDARYIDQLATLLEECVHHGLGIEQFKARLLRTFPLLEGGDENEIVAAVDLYKLLLDLEHRGINGIWARIIKNAFAPLFQGKFDYVAGNPPWVNWESLPEHYRQETKPLWQQQRLVVSQGQLGRMQEGKKDIAMLMTHVAMDNYLRERGHLGFVITQSVFKTSGAGQGFRRFTLGSGTPIRVIGVDDLVDLQPFEGATNRTAVVVFERDGKTRYPVPYSLWRRKTRGKSVPRDAALAEVIGECRVHELVAQPVSADDISSAWMTGHRRALQASSKVIGQSDYVAHEGANTGGANGVYWVNLLAERPDGFVVVSNLTEGAKRTVDTVQAAIEPDLLFPLLRGRDIKRWSAESQAHIIVVQDRARQREGISEPVLQTRYPKTYAYLRSFRSFLEERADRKYYPAGSPFYTMRNVAEYTYAPYKVVWTRVATDIQAAVVTQADVAGTAKPIVPIETVVFLPFESGLEAHYACAVMNSLPWRFVIVSSSVDGTGGFASPNVLQKARIPAFDPSSEIHLQLASLSERAYGAARGGERAALKLIEPQVDSLAAMLWGLTADELREIQESLAELEGAEIPVTADVGE